MVLTSTPSMRTPLILRPSMTRILPFMVSGTLALWALAELALRSFPITYKVLLVVLAALLALRWRSRFAIRVDPTSISARSRTDRSLRIPLHEIDWDKTRWDFSRDLAPVECTLFSVDGRSIRLLLALCDERDQEVLISAIPALRGKLEAARAAQLGTG
jgi:hypothetical protein